MIRLFKISRSLSNPLDYISDSISGKHSLNNALDLKDIVKQSKLSDIKNSVKYTKEQEGNLKCENEK